MIKRVEANDAASICELPVYYFNGKRNVQQDREKAKELLMRAAELGFSKAHYHLSDIYNKEGDLKKAKFHCEAAAMAGHELARSNLGSLEAQSGNMGRAVKHWIIAASAGYYHAMQSLRSLFEGGVVNRETIDSTLAAYNSSCAEMRSEPELTWVYIFYVPIYVRTDISLALVGGMLGKQRLDIEILRADI
jgi:TPR repeat protein